MFGDGGDVAHQRSLAFGRAGGGDGEAAENLLQDDRSLGEGEPEAEASAHTAAEWQPGVGCHAAVKEPARTKLCGFGVRYLAGVGQQDRRVDHRPRWQSPTTDLCRRGDLASGRSDDGVSAHSFLEDGLQESVVTADGSPDYLALDFRSMGKFPQRPGQGGGGCLMTGQQQRDELVAKLGIGQRLSRRVLGLQKSG
ncbi:Uncharacterised protein [Mycobacterium tuberculosis]|nr:Uncharacterised protein [Mycobacterium tuberculosis]CNL73773.1 Uncharacterised protein [Mycobacterium tuberculosis]CNN60483.1 Uncharacterised protein [Mycobacterium tuberculosis]